MYGKIYRRQGKKTEEFIGNPVIEYIESNKNQISYKLLLNFKCVIYGHYTERNILKWLKDKENIKYKKINKYKGGWQYIRIEYKGVKIYVW